MRKHSRVRPGRPRPRIKSRSRAGCRSSENSVFGRKCTAVVLGCGDIGFLGASGSVPNGKRQKSITFLLDDAVALAGAIFDARAVEHGYFTGVVVN